MQLSNMDFKGELGFILPEHLTEVLLAHGLNSATIPLFLKSLAVYFADDIEIQKPNLAKWIADFFELSESWILQGHGAITPPMDNASSLQDFIQFLILSKRKGWKPKLMFVRSENDKENKTLLLIELLKVTQTGIAVTTYKQWDKEIWQFAFCVCQVAGISAKGVYIREDLFEALNTAGILPVKALQEVKGLWFPEESILKSTMQTFAEKSGIQDLIKALSCTALQPTQLNL